MWLCISLLCISVLCISMFVDRKKELAELKEFLAHIQRGNKLNVALFGLRRIGKTEILLKFKDVNAQKRVIIPYINMQRIVPDVENFAKNFLNEIIFELSKIKAKPERPVSWEELLILSERIKIGEEIVKIKNILDRREVDEGAVLDLVFSLPEKISHKFNVKFIIIIDEFQEILVVHKNILKLMRAVTEKQQNVNYWVSGSVFSLFDDIFGHNNPYFGQFKRIALEGFERNSGYELIGNLLPGKIGSFEKRLIYDITGGVPFYITAICERMVQEYAIQQEINIDVVKYCILDEMFGETGKINEHFEYIMDVSLSKFSNKDIYKKILLYLSEEPDTLTGVSKHLRKPSGEVNSYIKSLLKTDLIIKKDGDYSIRDALFEGWLNKTLMGIDRFSLNDEKTYQRVFSELKEKYEKVSIELGRLKEYELRTRLEEITGIQFQPYSTPDGQIEFDLVGEWNGIVYIIEIKWRNRFVGFKDIENFNNKVNNSKFKNKENRMIIISKTGFNENAIKKANEENIICIDKDISPIFKIIEN